MTICSLVIHTRPENLFLVSREIEKLEGVEIRGRSKAGMLVVLIDHPKRGHCSDAMMSMAKMDGVVNTSLVYEYFESEEPPQIPHENNEICLKEVS